MTAPAPDSPALATGEITWSRREIVAQAAAWREHITAHAPGAAPIALIAPAAPPLIAALLGAWQAGRHVVVLNPRVPAPALEALIETAGASAAWTLPALVQQLADVGCPVAPLEALPPHSGPAAELPKSGGLILATSGSSGAPKLAQISAGALIESARRANTNIPLGPGDRSLLSLPLFHVSGIGILLRAWLAGACIDLPAPGTALPDALARFRPTHLSLVATQLRRLLNDPAGPELLRPAKAILLGGSAIPPALTAAAHALGLPLHKSYGLTEMGSQVTTTRPGAGLDELATSGYALAPDTVRISGEGEIEVTGATLFDGYLHAPGLPELPLSPDGWFRTGDLGALDAAGRLVVLGRRDSMYISGGENVHPETVERALAGIAGVEQCMVVPVPDDEFGTLGWAFVELTEGTPWDAEALRHTLKEHLAPHEVPRYIHPWPVDLATTGIKPSRKALHALALKLHEA